MKIPTSFLLTVLFVFITQNSALWGVHANDDEKTDINDKQIKDPNTADETECSNLADFYYEIVMGVTSFPKQGDCSIEEEAEIASFLQDKINTYLGTLPGTIGTKNKVCSNPINNHRQLQPASNNNISDTFTHTSLRSLKSLLRGSIHPVTTTKEQNVRILHRRRSFIYVGGGKCRYCLNDNSDHRALSPELEDLPIRTTRTTTRATLSNNDPKRINQKRDLLSAEAAGTTLDEVESSLTAPTGPANTQLSKIQNRLPRGRNLLFLTALKLHRNPLRKVADVLFCKEFDAKAFYLEAKRAEASYRDMITWTKLKETLLPVLLYGRSEFVYWDIIGPYVPGESFGVQLDMGSAAQQADKNHAEYLRDRYGDDVDLVQLPVKEGNIRFRLYAFDMPTDASLTADSLIVFVNGIMLDFKLLMSEPGVKTVKAKMNEVMKGSSFAGIKWEITRWKYSTHHGKNFAHGPLPDITYDVSITAPLIVFEHRNQLDISFIIHPNAKANKYAISLLRVSLVAARCDVTGIEDSPFEDFKSVVESRLFQRLGLDLADEFQGKEGHCFYEKIPMVNVNLVEKEDWKNSNPRCD